MVAQKQKPRDILQGWKELSTNLFSLLVGRKVKRTARPSGLSWSHRTPEREEAGEQEVCHCKAS